MLCSATENCEQQQSDSQSSRHGSTDRGSCGRGHRPSYDSSSTVPLAGAIFLDIASLPLCIVRKRRSIGEVSPSITATGGERRDRNSGRKTLQLRGEGESGATVKGTTSALSVGFHCTDTNGTANTSSEASVPPEAMSSRSWRQLPWTVGINLVAFGAHLCACGCFVYLPPMLRKAGFSEKVTVTPRISWRSCGALLKTGLLCTSYFHIGI
ncbi:hypothetical protein MRX96_031793 [Rhipicephalus microplus]